MQQKSSREIVLQAIETICEHRDAATRPQVMALTSLKRQIVDDHIKTLKNDGLIKMEIPGFYSPIDQEPDRIVSTTMLPRGRVKIEIEDQIMTLNPREALNLAKFLAGTLLAFRNGM